MKEVGKDGGGMREVWKMEQKKQKKTRGRKDQLGRMEEVHGELIIVVRK